MRTRIIFYLRCAAYLRLLPRTRPQPNTAVDSNTLTEAGYARSDYENNPTVLHPVISLQFQFTLQKTQHLYSFKAAQQSQKIVRVYIGLSASACSSLLCTTKILKSVFHRLKIFQNIISGPELMCLQTVTDLREVFIGNCLMDLLKISDTGMILFSTAAFFSRHRKQCKIGRTHV